MAKKKGHTGDPIKKAKKVVDEMNRINATTGPSGFSLEHDLNYNSARLKELGLEPIQGHNPSVDPETGMWLKGMNHPTAWKEYLFGSLNKDIGTNYDVKVNPKGYFGNEQLQYVHKDLALGGYTNNSTMAQDQLTNVEGPSHEGNPLGGIPMGPNANVEGGETIQNDANYVFSDRNVVDKETAEEFGLNKKWIGKTFAEASKLAGREKSFRKDNEDGIEQEAIARDLDKLRNAQEAWKQKEFQKDMQMMQEKHPEMMQSLTQPSTPPMPQQGEGMPMPQEQAGMVPPAQPQEMGMPMAAGGAMDGVDPMKKYANYVNAYGKGQEWNAAKDVLKELSSLATQSDTGLSDDYRNAYRDFYGYVNETFPEELKQMRLQNISQGKQSTAANPIYNIQGVGEVARPFNVEGLAVEGLAMGGFTNEPPTGDPEKPVRTAGWSYDIPEYQSKSYPNKKGVMTPYSDLSWSDQRVIDSWEGYDVARDSRGRMAYNYNPARRTSVFGDDGRGATVSDANFITNAGNINGKPRMRTHSSGVKRSTVYNPANPSIPATVPIGIIGKKSAGYQQMYIGDLEEAHTPTAVSKPRASGGYTGNGIDLPIGLPLAGGGWQTAGNILQTAGSAVGNIPGWGSIVGAGLGAIGAGVGNVGTGADFKEVAKDAAFGAAKAGLGTAGSAAVGTLEGMVNDNSIDASEKKQMAIQAGIEKGAQDRLNPNVNQIGLPLNGSGAYGGRISRANGGPIGSAIAKSQARPDGKYRYGDTEYRKVDGNWEKKMGNKFVPLTAGDVKKRSRVLEKGAVALNQEGIGLPYEYNDAGLMTMNPTVAKNYQISTPEDSAAYRKGFDDMVYNIATEEKTPLITDSYRASHNVINADNAAQKALNANDRLGLFEAMGAHDAGGRRMFLQRENNRSEDGFYTYKGRPGVLYKKEEGKWYINTEGKHDGKFKELEPKYVSTKGPTWIKNEKGEDIRVNRWDKRAATLNAQATPYAPSYYTEGKAMGGYTRPLAHGDYLGLPFSTPINMGINMGMNAGMNAANKAVEASPFLQYGVPVNEGFYEDISPEEMAYRKAQSEIDPENVEKEGAEGEGEGEGAPEYNLKENFGQWAASRAPIAYNTLRGIMPIDELNARDYYDTYDVLRPNKYDPTNLYREVGENYQAALNRLSGLKGGAKQAYARSLMNKGNEMAGNIINQQRAQDFARMQEYDKRKHGQFTANRQADLMAEDINRRAEANRRAHMSEAAKQIADLEAARKENELMKFALQMGAPDFADRLTITSYLDDLKDKRQAKKTARKTKRKK